MTRKDAERINAQEYALLSLGFTSEEAEALRRISMTLHRWHEGECGTDNACIVRGRIVDGDFVYDDKGDPYWEFAGLSGRGRYSRMPDRERGAMNRLRDILNARNERMALAHSEQGSVWYYIQSDPRGAALWIIRPGDVPEGADVSAYYTRGIAVY